MERQLDRHREMERIEAMFGRDQASIMAMLERQFGVLHNRTQVLLGLCGIVITTTGFSGRIIAGTNSAAQISIIAGVGLVLLAAVWVSWGVLHLRWLTQQPGAVLEQWLATTLAYRDRKTRIYRQGVILMLSGLTCYVVAIAIMLRFPEMDAVPLVR